MEDSIIGLTNSGIEQSSAISTDYCTPVFDPGYLAYDTKKETFSNLDGRRFLEVFPDEVEEKFYRKLIASLKKLTDLLTNGLRPSEEVKIYGCALLDIPCFNESTLGSQIDLAKKLAAKNLVKDDKIKELEKRLKDLNEGRLEKPGKKFVTVTEQIGGVTMHYRIKEGGSSTNLIFRRFQRGSNGD